MKAHGVCWDEQRKYWRVVRHGIMDPVAYANSASAEDAFLDRHKYSPSLFSRFCSICGTNESNQTHIQLNNKSHE